MLSRDEIRKKKKYIVEKLKTKVDALEEEKLKSTLISFIILESYNDKLKNIKLFNLLEKISNGAILEKSTQKFRGMWDDLKINYSSYIDNDYVSFLLQLANNLSQIQVQYDEDETELLPFNFSNEYVIKLSKLFYKELGDKYIEDKAMAILNDESHYGFTKTVLVGNELDYGMTIYDTVFNKPYITCQKLGNLMELQAFNHEIMHGIDFYSMPKIPSQIYYGFHEIPTYTIDYLFHDYLDNMGIDKQQVKALRRKKLQYTKLTASRVLFQIQHRLNEKFGMKNTVNATIQDIKSVITDDLLKEMLEMESCVIADGLYNQILIDKELGLKNLKMIMEHPLPRDKIPDFSFIGLDNNSLLNLSQNIMISSAENNQKNNMLQEKQLQMIRRLINKDSNKLAFIKSSFLIIIIVLFAILIAVLMIKNGGVI